MRNDVCVECECVELCEEVESKRAKVFRCLMLMLSGPVELLFLLFLIASLIGDLVID